ncbi:hypothetical protein [Limimaricola pyoseonensis]|uniref:Uncharacterized protein n=1 Tax=Limimaricola pyoseonensis TaxID=521013 RepID=A0A1G7IX42_9RHOB|nr:hypothetical protein [Limimaricola pyoseonensis]SDF17251.1 hypothetical protein SAMN04488567_3559 [Limimaricola pyoseonensis]
MGAAQEPAGGPMLRLGLSQQFEAASNPALSADPDPMARAVSALDLALSSETRRERLSLGFGAELRAETEGGAEFAAPALRLDYGRVGAGAALDAAARLSAREIAYLAPLPDLGASGLPPEIADIEDLRGTGTRVAGDVSARLRLGEGGPLGGHLGLRASAIEYRDASAPELRDSERLAFEAGLRLAPGGRGEIGLDLGLAGVEQAGGPRRETASLELSLERAARRGAVGGAARIERAEGGERYALSARRRVELPRGTLDGRLGLSRDTGGDWGLSGRVDLRREIGAAALSLGAERAVITTAEGERWRSALRLGWERPLGEAMRIGFDLSAQHSAAADGEARRAVQAAARLSRTLTRDWSLDLTARAAGRDAPGEAAARDYGLSLGLSRALTLPF